MRHVRPELGPDLVGDRAERGEVQVAGVGGPARDDDIRLLGERGRAHLVHLDAVRLLVDAVRGHLVQAAGEVDLHPVGEVTPVGEASPMMRSPGLMSAWRTAALAVAPE